MTVVGRLPLLACVLAFSCGSRQLGGASQPDATAAADVLSESAAADLPSERDAAADIVWVPPGVDASGGLPLIEVDCTPQFPEIGRFYPQGYISEAWFAGADHGVPLLTLERVADAGGWVGTIAVYVHRPQQVVLGQPLVVGGADPSVTVRASSGSVVMNLVQTIPDTDAGGIVFDAFDPARQISGRFIDVSFSTYPRPPTYPCRISNSQFVAVAPPPPNP